MKTLLGILFVLVLVAVGFGFYRGWFTVSSSETNQGNKVNLNLELDPDKMREDADEVTMKAKELTGNVTGGNTAPDDQ